MNLILDLYKDRYELNNFLNKGTISHNELVNHFSKLIDENIMKYKGKLFHDIYTDNDFMQLENENKSHIWMNTTSENYGTKLRLVVYKCIKTRSFGYTYLVNDLHVLHPLHIVSHHFKLVEVGNIYIEYRCKNCNIQGLKRKSNKNAPIIIDSKNFIYSCDDIIIKNIIE